jgi:DNA-binding NtrC family response regulator
MGQILIVDDQECVRRLLRAELTLAGYQVLRGASYCLHVEKPSGDIFFEVRSLGCGL